MFWSLDLGLPFSLVLPEPEHLGIRMNSGHHSSKQFSPVFCYRHSSFWHVWFMVIVLVFLSTLNCKIIWKETLFQKYWTIFGAALIIWQHIKCCSNKWWKKYSDCRVTPGRMIYIYIQTVSEITLLLYSFIDLDHIWIIK